VESVPPFARADLTALYAGAARAPRDTAAAGDRPMLLHAHNQLGPAEADLAARAQRAKEAMAAGQFDEAAAGYAEVVKAMPGDAGMRLNLGMALSMAGRIQEAVPHLERAVTLQPALMPAWLFIGASRLQLGEPDRALAPLRKVAAAEPDNTRARELLGEALMALERYEGAVVQFRAVTTGEPSRARGWFGLGKSYEALARAAFARLAHVTGGSPYALLLQADVFAASGNLPRAIELYRQVLADDPTLRTAREELARAVERAGEVETASREREQLRGEPSCETATAAARRQAACEFRAGRYAAVPQLLKGSRTAESSYWLARAYNELARNAFDRLVELPPSPELHQFRAAMHRDRGQHLDAAEELRLALQMVPGDVPLQQELATALLDAKSYDEAIQLLEPLARRTSSADTLFLLGDALLISGRAEEALAPLRATVSRAPAFLPARRSLGRAYLQTGNPRASIPHLEAALKIDEDGSVHYQLARAYQATGREELAKKMLARYAAIVKGLRR